jgi:uncharacterized protein (DUF1501 family)
LFGSLMGKLSIAHAALDTSQYKALVCINLYGGNDSVNTVIPRTPSFHATYAKTRGALTVPINTLLPLLPRGDGTGVPTDGSLYGFHPGMQGLADLFNGGDAAIVGNVGPLVQPVTKDQYRAGTAVLPPQLGSHSDQSVFWQTPLTTTERVGWGGKLVDMLYAQDPNTSALSSISLDGENVLQSGVASSPYYLRVYDRQSAPVEVIQAVSGAENARRNNTLETLMNLQLGHPMQRAYRDQLRRTRDIAADLKAALATTTDQADFPDTPIGNQLRMVARLLSIRAQFGLSRQVFYVGHGGFDTHAGQLGEHPRLLEQMSDAIAAFQTAVNAMTLQNAVTTFTVSEFGRTLTNNGDGTDHGWGGHQLVVGGAVSGRAFYGHMPNLADTNNSDDLDTGQLIPQVAVEQFGATLAKWFGLPDVDRPLIFPNLGRFTRHGGANLGFMG